ncbi:MAG: L-glutamate gamma-semialdehyde dehydrogenase, partial [Burkholderiales bacterium]
PRALYGDNRPNSRGLDLASEKHLAALAHSLSHPPPPAWIALPLLGDGERRSGLAVAVHNPGEHDDVVGTVIDASMQDVVDAVAQSVAAAPGWQATLPAQRAEVLDRAAGLLEDHLHPLIGLIVREAGKTMASAVGEVREATDFLRYYAAQLRQPGWSNQTHRAIGPVVCISPWNFPLAIFTGQVAAALAAGNTVLAKPAEQTPLVAAEAVRLLHQALRQVLHEAGVPPAVLQLLPGPGETVGAALVADARIRGVLFTGSTDVARLLQRSLAGRLDEHGRPPVLVAETGGLNAMIVDSSALPEQVVADVLTSAFDSAGQRCSALRLLCLQAEVADAVLTMLKGALHELAIGRPDALRTDVGPVIDEPAREAIEMHVATMRAAGHRVHRLALPPGLNGTFVAPTVIELNDVAELTREVFGPVLHVVRYRQGGLAALVDRINASGYGLTMGLHTRIDETLRLVTARARVGNLYVNRHMVGAVVGVQPFGGEGCSGTGPKAGGPLTLRRLLAQHPVALEAAPGLVEAPARATASPALGALQSWLNGQGLAELAALAQAQGAASPAGLSLLLPGPTGERNTYALVPREAVFTVAGQRDDLLHQLIVVLAAGSRAVWPAADLATALWQALPAVVQERVTLAENGASAAFDAALVSGSDDAVRALALALAQRPGPIVALQSCAPGRRQAGAYALDGLLLERAVSVNTAAAGGNASLMTIG